MLVSIDKRTSALAAVLAARHFAVNFLSTEATEIADMFGGKGSLKGAARFETARWQTLTTGAPVLASALGAMDCGSKRRSSAMASASSSAASSTSSSAAAAIR